MHIYHLHEDKKENCALRGHSETEITGDENCNNNMYFLAFLEVTRI